MHPFILDGDALVVQPIERRPPRIGEVLLCRDSTGLVLVHRLVRAHGSGAQRRLITKGDNVAGCDAPLSPDQVLGRVVAVKRGDKIVRLDGMVGRAWAWFWAQLSPWSRWLRPRLRPQRWLLRLVPGLER